MEENPENKGPQSTEWGLDIVSCSTPKKRRRENLNCIDPKDEAIIEKFEDCLEKFLNEKAAKSNLSKGAVKSILKYVVTDENVLTLLKHKEKGEDASEVIPFEPKITRSKAKELSNSGSTTLLPWNSTVSKDSKALELLADDLHEESSDDEYVPVEEESEEDSSYFVESNPPTPSTRKAKESEVPPLNTVEFENNNDDCLQSDKAANIALRTRSKLSLSETPLEKIELSFVPPDIPNDMYELECNDDDWKNFLSSFAQPLDEVKNVEEEDLDPEYNILADEEITKVDTEELRDDRAVRVPKRELNDLIAELFEYVDIYENRKDFQNLEINIDPNSYPIQQLELDRYIEIFDGASNKQIDLNLEEDIPSCVNKSTSDIYLEHFKPENPLDNLFSKVQLQLLLQQMSQHVQMLLQNFILTCNHPCFNEYAYEFKEFLLNFKLLSDNKDVSVFNTINLKAALTFMENWEKKFEENSEEAVETIKQFEEVMAESVDKFLKKEYYYLPLPESILKAISESEAFLYPQLLPKIPFKHPDLQNYNYAPFSISEYQLVALGLEQFIQFLINDKEFLRGQRGINMMKIAEVIQKMLMPGRKTYQIYKNIREKRHSKYSWDRNNPITFYFKNKRAPYTVHQVIDLNQFGILPPKERPANLLPRQWRRYIYQIPQDGDNDELIKAPSKPVPVLKKPTVHRRILPKGPIPEEKIVSETLKSSKTLFNCYLKKRCENCFRRPIPYVEYNKLIKNSKFLNNFFPHQGNINSDWYKATSQGNFSSLHSLYNMTDVQKGNVEDQENEGKAKNRDEFLASIAKLAPPNPESERERRRDFSVKFMDKLQETLGLDKFKKIMKIFSNGKVLHAVDLYMKMTPFLLPEHQDLADEYLLFLTGEQAHAMAQLTPFFIMNHMAKFSRYLKFFSKYQPDLSRNVHQSLQNLNDSPQTNLENIEKAILPLLKSNSLLCDGFLRIFLEESEPESLLNGAWDAIEVNEKLKRAKEGLFEILTVTDEDCTCSCRISDGGPLQKNCIKCGGKFLGRTVYCQTYQEIKPINIPPRLNVPAEIPRIDQNANEKSSPHIEILPNTQSSIQFEDGKKRKVRVCKSKKKSSPKPKRDEYKDNKKPFKKRLASLRVITQSNPETQKTVPVTEGDWKNLPSSFNTNSSHNKEEKSDEINEEITICKEEITFTEETIKREKSDQDKLKNVDISNIWTKEEDRILLETYKQNDHTDPVNLIKQQLKNRSEDEIRLRFDTLMKILQEMYLRGDSKK